MSISQKQAADALSDVARVEQRAAILRGYEHGAPHFILWGVVTAVGYVLSDWAPTRAPLAWMVVSLLGQIGSIQIARSAVASGAVHGANRAAAYAACGATVVAFTAATYFVMGAHATAQFGAFPPLLMATGCTLVGIWRGARWAVAGICLGVGTLAGFILFPAHFMLWMAAICGGTLVLTGLWLRRV